MKNDNIKLMLKYLSVLLSLVAGLNTGYSQTAEKGKSLKELLQIAEANYPLLKAKLMDVQAAQKAVTASKSTLIPTLDAAYQINYATYNNITGMANGQFLVPITGPATSTNYMEGVFGSSASLLFNWQPITFGQRKT